MKVPAKLAWAGVLAAGVALASRLTYQGYQADELGTSGGTITSVDLALLGALAVMLALALHLTVGANRGRASTVPASHVSVALVGAAASVVLWPALLIPLGILGYHVVRRPETTLS